MQQLPEIETVDSRNEIFAQNGQDTMVGEKYALVSRLIRTSWIL